MYPVCIEGLVHARVKVRTPHPIVLNGDMYADVHCSLLG